MTLTQTRFTERTIGWLGRITGGLLTLTALVVALSAMPDSEADGVNGGSTPPTAAAP